MFSTTVIAPYSYVDRATASSDKSTRSKIRRLQSAIEQPGIIIGIYGESKGGKTMFTRKTLTDAGYGFIVAEASEIRSVDDYWRQIAEKLQLNIRRIATNEKQLRSSAGVSTSANPKFSIGAISTSFDILASAEVAAIDGLQIQSEVIDSVRNACLNFLESTRMAVLLDDFHAIESEKLRKEILQSVKIPAGQNQGKYIFISIPQETLFVGQKDEQFVGRDSTFEFPLWEEEDLELIAMQGFEKLGIGCEGRWLKYISKNAFYNPINVQQICIDYCAMNRWRKLSDIPKGAEVQQSKLAEALKDFAVGLSFFDNILRKAEEKSPREFVERRYELRDVAVNLYEMIFIALSSPAATSEYGILVSTIRKKILKLVDDPDLNDAKLDRAVQRLVAAKVSIDFARKGPESVSKKKPMIYVKERRKILVGNPMFRVYLLWGFLPRLGLEKSTLKEIAEGLSVG